MPSTYTTNLGIEKIATGEQSGTWGNTTNTNLDLIDQAVNGVEQITLSAAGSSGSPNDLPITNGASSNGRNKFIEFIDGGDLGATAYVQLTPNDAEKIVFVRNSLTTQSLIIFQGTYSASNDFEIPNGADVLLKFNGAGSGATVTDVFNKLNVTSLVSGAGSFTTLTASSTVDFDSGSIDGTTIGSATPSTGAFTTLSASGDANFDSNTLFVDASENKVGIGTSTPAVSLDLTSKTDAVAMPAGTTAQRPTGVNGQIRYNSTDSAFEGYANGAWGEIGGGGGATGGGSDQVFYENDQTVTANYELTANTNAMSTGPVSVGSGVTVTIPSGSRYVVI